MTAIYNEIEPYPAQWMRNLIQAQVIEEGIVDERSIVELKPDDVRGYGQAHFFAGIGVWSFALKQVGWPKDVPVWTGSCPCQPFSSAGKRKGTSDERHLWPEWFRLIKDVRPLFVFGEQVASKDGLLWLDLVCSDLEGAGYTVWPVDICAAGLVGAPHIRQRLYFCAFREGDIDDDTRGRLRRIVDQLADPDQGRCGEGGRCGCLHGQVSAEGSDIALSLEERGSFGCLADAKGRGGRDNAPGEEGGRSTHIEVHGAPGNTEPTTGDLADTAIDGRDVSEEPSDVREMEQRKRWEEGAGGRGQLEAIGSSTSRYMANPEQWAAERHGLEVGGASGGDEGEIPEWQRVWLESGTGEPASVLADPERDGGAGVSGLGGEPAQRPLGANVALGFQRGPTNGFWGDAEWLACRDGRARPTQPGLFPLAHGSAQRVRRLRAYGNAIVAPCAIEFVRACVEEICSDAPMPVTQPLPSVPVTTVRPKASELW